MKLNSRLALPNPTIGAFGGHEQNTERFIGIAVEIPLPIFNRRQGEATALAGRLAQAQQKVRATELNVEHEVRDAYGKYAAALRALKASQEDVVAPARESFGLLEAAFNAGKLDLLSLSVAERQSFDAQMGYLDAWFNFTAAKTSLESRSWRFRVKRRNLLVIATIIGFVPSLVAAQTTTPILLKISPSSQAGRELVLASVTRKSMHQRIGATATIEPDAGAIADVSSVIPARVMKLIAQPGQYVRAGEPLAILSSVELGEAKTEYLKARSLETITAQNLKREQDLYAKKITPMKDLLEARARHDAALAEYQGGSRETSPPDSSGRFEHRSMVR